jgi:hypothetical protein
MAMRDSMMQMAEHCSPEQPAKQLGSDRFKLMTWPAYERANAFYEQTYGVPLAMSGHSFTAWFVAVERERADDRRARCLRPGHGKLARQSLVVPGESSHSNVMERAR